MWALIPRDSQWPGSKKRVVVGKDAADFLHGVNIAVGAGLLSPVTGGTAYVSWSARRCYVIDAAA